MDRLIDKRKHSRIPFEMNVELYSLTGKTTMGKSINISFGGMKIILEDKCTISCDDEFDLKLLLDRSRITISINFQCKVIYVKGDIIGVQFTSIEMDSYNHFKNLMVANSPEPEKLLEELQQHPGILKDLA